jgi:hypothetical protein
MSCTGGKSVKKGKYSKTNNLQKPIDYTIDKNGNIKAIYPKTK